MFLQALHVIIGGGGATPRVALYLVGRYPDHFGDAVGLQ